ncbi:MAG: FAD-binding protein [Elusimicrobia bacterium]|nr:FAD-binding protein [Elusimicrobiota bacterium]
MAENLLELKRCFPENRLLLGPVDLLTYGYDSALDRALPEAVVLAESAQEVREVVRFCLRHNLPYVARGAGTNLSGGCIPSRGGVVLSTAKMARILEIEPSKRYAVVEPGAVNLHLQKALEPYGFYYAPDPASFRVCTLGGNVAENAGGPRCLKYGVTSQHVLGLEAVLPDGEIYRLNREDSGPDLTGLLVGSEGTLGVVTKIWLQILERPACVRTMLAGFSGVDSAIQSVSRVIASGIVPRTLEAMDQLTVRAVEEFSPAGYPVEAAAVLLVEVDGTEEETLQEAEKIERICRAQGAFHFVLAQTEEECERLWEGRRGAYAAMARLAPNVLVEDGVVPRNRLPEVLARVQEIAARYRIRVGLLFHAGDGNLHPNIIFDERNAEETQRVKLAGYEILKACVELGGSISGEHGIGSDKREAMRWLFSSATLNVFRRVKETFDPRNLANPDKILPLPDGKASGVSRPHGEAAERLFQGLREAASQGRRVSIRGFGSRLPSTPSPEAPSVPAPFAELRAPAGEPEAPSVLETRSLDRVLDWDRENYTVRVEAGISVASLREILAAENYFTALAGAGSLGGLIATKAVPEIRDQILGMRVALGTGEILELGGKVVKNVAGYDLAKIFYGSWGWYGLILEVILKLYPRPISVAPAKNQVPFSPHLWHRRLKAALDPAGIFSLPR